MESKKWKSEKQILNELKEENSQLKKQITSQQQTIERLREKASTLLSRLERRKPKNGYIFSVSIAIQDLQTVIEEAEQLLNTTEPNKTV